MKNCNQSIIDVNSESNNLPKLGVLCLKRVYVEDEDATDATLSTQRRLIPEGKTITFTIIGDGYFMSTYGGQSIGKEVTVQKGSSNLSYYTSNGNYDIEIKEKYDFTLGLNNSQRAIRCDIADTYYTLTKIITSPGMYGDLGKANPEHITTISIYSQQLGKVYYKSEDIGKFVNVTQIGFDTVDGFPEINMSDFGKLVSITGWNQIPCAVGSIEEFVAAQRAGGRTTFDGTLNLSYIGFSGKVTFNGSVIENVAVGNITWTASTITFRDVTITA